MYDFAIIKGLEKFVDFIIHVELACFCPKYTGLLKLYILMFL